MELSGARAWGHQTEAGNTAYLSGRIWSQEDSSFHWRNHPKLEPWRRKNMTSLFPSPSHLHPVPPTGRTQLEGSWSRSLENTTWKRLATWGSQQRIGTWEMFLKINRPKTPTCSFHFSLHVIFTYQCPHQLLNIQDVSSRGIRNWERKESSHASKA